MKILLIPPKSNYPSSTPNIQLVPLGFPYIAAALKKHGIEVDGLTLNYIDCTRHVLKRKIREAIRYYRPDFIGVGGLSAEYLFVRDVIRVARDCDSRIRIVLGGGLISSDPEYIMNDLKPDYGVLGDGEETIVEIVRGKDREKIKGIAFWDERTNKSVFNERRESIKDLDALPFPDYGPFDIETYFEMSNNFDSSFYGRTRTNPRIIPLSGARSCPFRCTFCWHSEPYRKRSTDSVIEEIIYMYEKYKFNVLMIYDEMLGRDRARELSQKIKELKLDFDWFCSMRVPNVDLDTLKMMKDAGCTFVGYGFESASQSVLNSMNKKITVEQIKRAVELTEKAGLGVQANFIFGDPAETPETMKETRDLYDHYYRDLIVHNGYIIPFPGSEVFKHCISKGIINDKKKYYETIHTVPIYNMTKMDDTTFLGILRPILADNRFKKSLISVKQEGEKNRISTTCPHCTVNVVYLFPNRYEIVYAGETNVFCPHCNRKFNIPTRPLIKPALKHFLRRFKLVVSLKILLRYLKRCIGK